MKYFNLLFIVLIAISCNSNQKKINKEIMEENRFVRVDDNLALGTSLILNREMKNPNSMIGDFLSRIWRIYGEPKNVNYEGFVYTFKDTKTGLLFTAYSAGSGPAYGGKYEESEKLIPVIKSFDEMLDSTTPADCELQFETDFGTMKSGAKNGTPYDIIEEE
ncbi:hypothetical protein [Flavobacterium sp.]|jgi:hypothetical protein|uniref:hypothetical protein n=1 Tax=Flavobacterium sp. TaxID=239 RepID=UPI0037C0FE44